VNDEKDYCFNDLKCGSGNFDPMPSVAGVPCDLSMHKSRILIVASQSVGVG